MTATPRHPGSRVVDHAPNLLRTIRALQADLRKLRDRTRPETVQFTDADIARGVPCVSATFINTHVTYLYRSGVMLYIDVAAGTGAGSVMEFQLSAPLLNVTGAAAQTPSGGTERIVRVTMPLPDTWQSGEAFQVYLEGRRVSGSDSTTVRVLRAWQR